MKQDLRAWLDHRVPQDRKAPMVFRGFLACLERLEERDQLAILEAQDLREQRESLVRPEKMEWPD